MTLSEARRTFADLMQQARKGPLTERARARLSQARQMLRRAKRPAMNPRKPYRKPYHSLEPQIFESMAYRGYLIKFNALRNEYWIEKDGAFISYAQTIPEAKRKIDEIFGDNPRKLTRTKARRILHEGLTPRQRGYFGARASGAPRRNSPKTQRIGRAVEVRYKRDIGRSPGYYKHEIQSRKAGVYTIPPGWVYVSTKSILITEREPHVSR